MIDRDDRGAPFGNRLSSSTEPLSAQGLGPSGFDPARGLHILQHSLGVDRYGRGSRYRNHFVTGEGSVDYADCCALVEAGLMTRQKGGRLTGGDDVFYVTDEGKTYVTVNSPSPPKLTKSQECYRAWLQVADATGESFIQFCRRRDRDGAEGGDANAAPVPQDRQARAEGIAQPPAQNPESQP